MRKLGFVALIVCFGFLLTAAGCQVTNQAPQQQVVNESAISATAVGGPMPGAIWTCNSTGASIDQNLYDAKTDVYLNGGPNSNKSAGLPEGDYYLKVTEPNGTILGKSLTAVLHVNQYGVLGDPNNPYQVWVNVNSASSDFTVTGYDDTTNPGGEYKVWVSQDPAFANSASKTDNFKVKRITNTTSIPENPPHLIIYKFYDANANGVKDESEELLIDWQVSWDSTMGDTPVNAIVNPGSYTVTESLPIETNWVPTTPITVNTGNISSGQTVTVNFGNVCLGAGGGLTLGFWSNKNGQRLFSAPPDDLASMVGLNLRNANGTDFDPASYTAFRTWLLSANATNMAYMLSAQLAAMKLNVNNNKVSGTARVYAPGLLLFASTINNPTTVLNALGFIKTSDLMAAANTELGLHGNTTSGTPGAAYRAYQEALKNVLDKANNNMIFVQSTPCPFNFLNP